MARKTELAEGVAPVEITPESINPSIALSEALGSMAVDPAFAKSPTLPTGVAPPGAAPAPAAPEAADDAGRLPKPPGLPGNACSGGCGRAVGVDAGELPFFHDGAVFCARCFAKSPDGVARHAQAVRCGRCELVAVRGDGLCARCHHGNLLPAT